MTIFIELKQIAYHNYNSDVYWFYDEGKIYRGKGRGAFKQEGCLKMLGVELESIERPEFVFSQNLKDEVRILCIENEIPILHHARDLKKARK